MRIRVRPSSAHVWFPTATLFPHFPIDYRKKSHIPFSNGRASRKEKKPQRARNTDGAASRPLLSKGAPGRWPSCRTPCGIKILGWYHIFFGLKRRMGMTGVPPSLLSFQRLFIVFPDVPTRRWIFRHANFYQDPTPVCRRTPKKINQGNAKLYIIALEF